MLGQVIQEPQGIILEKAAQPKIVRLILITCPHHNHHHCCSHYHTD